MDETAVRDEAARAASEAALRVLPRHRLAVEILAPPGATLPWGWRDAGQAAAYLLMDRAGDAVHGARYGLFTFSLLPREPIFGAAGLRSACGRWTFRLASARREALEAAEATMAHPAWPGTRVLLALLGPRAELLGAQWEPLAVGRRVFRAQPILVFARKGEGPWAFLPPEHERFARAVAGALARRWEHLFGSRWAGGTGFSFCGEPRQKLIQFRGRGLVAWAGAVRLEAPEPMLLFAQAVGLGHKPSAGLGMIL